MLKDNGPSKKRRLDTAGHIESITSTIYDLNILTDAHTAEYKMETHEKLDSRLSHNTAQLLKKQQTQETWKLENEFGSVVARGY